MHMKHAKGFVRKKVKLYILSMLGSVLKELVWLVLKYKVQIKLYYQERQNKV